MRGSRAGPVEEAKGLEWGGGAGAEDAVDEIGGDGDFEAVERTLEVEVFADDVRYVVHGGKVVVAAAATACAVFFFFFFFKGGVRWAPGRQRMKEGGVDGGETETAAENGGGAEEHGGVIDSE